MMYEKEELIFRAYVETNNITAEIKITYNTANNTINSMLWSDKSIVMAIVSLIPNLKASSKPTADKIEVMLPKVAVTMAMMNIPILNVVIVIKEIIFNQLNSVHLYMTSGW